MSGLVIVFTRDLPFLHSVFVFSSYLSPEDYPTTQDLFSCIDRHGNLLYTASLASHLLEEDVELGARVVK